MTELYRYTRGVGRAITKTPAGDTPLRAGEMIALPGKKHRTYRAPVTLDANNKPVQTPLHPVEGIKKKRRKKATQDWLELDLGMKVIETLDRLR